MCTATCALASLQLSAQPAFHFMSDQTCMVTLTRKLGVTGQSYNLTLHIEYMAVHTHTNSGKFMSDE